jgi:hypothetical protein
VISILLVLAGLRVAAAVNLSGVKNLGWIQTVTTILEFFGVGSSPHPPGAAIPPRHHDCDSRPRVLDPVHLVPRNTGDSLWVYCAPFVLAGAPRLLGGPAYDRYRLYVTDLGAMPPYAP